MTPDELAFLSLSQVADLIQHRVISPVELTTAALERIERLNPLLNAFITVLAVNAIEEARQAEAAIRHGDYRGALHGMPYSLKDVVETAGVRTTAGSPILGDYVPDRNATVYERLKLAGGVLLGKNAMLEFAYGSPHPEFGLTRNPWNLDYSASGSSSGSAAAVAAGIGYGSIGSDTGGSIRMPASWCGLVGLKPSYGRVSLHGIIPLATSLDHVGPLTRTARDAAILLGAIAGYDRRDPHSANVPVPDYLAWLEKPLPPLRVGVDRGAMAEFVAEPILQAVEQAIAVLERLGTSVVPIAVPDPASAARVATTLMSVEAASYHRRNLEQQPERYSDAVRTRLRRGIEVSDVTYLEARQERERIRRAYIAIFDEIDVLLTPTSVVPTMSLDEVRAELRLPPSDPMSRRTLFTAPINLIGFPALSLPTGLTANGLPIGMQLVGRPFDEETLLAIADRYEHETGWTDAHPAI